MSTRSRPSGRPGASSRSARPAADAPAVSLDRIGRFLAAICALCALATFPASALFGLQAVTVEGNAAVPTSEILQRAGLAPGESVFRVDAARIRAAVLSDPRIQDVSVAIAFPHHVTIVVRERRPVAALAIAGAYILIGADGTVLARASTPSLYPLLQLEHQALPGGRAGTVVPSSDLRLGARVAGMIPDRLRSRLGAVRITSGGEVVLQLRDGVSVRLGGEHLADRLRTLPEVLDAVEARGQRVEYVDVRFRGSVVVRPIPRLAPPGPHSDAAPRP